MTANFSNFEFDGLKGEMGNRQCVFCRDVRGGIHRLSNFESARKVPNAHSEALSQVHNCERLVQMHIHIAVWSPKLGAWSNEKQPDRSANFYCHRLEKRFAGSTWLAVSSREAAIFCTLSMFADAMRYQSDCRRHARVDSCRHLLDSIKEERMTHEFQRQMLVHAAL